MTNQQTYRILCDMEGTFLVQMREDILSGWETVHHCENKNEAGLNEARRWIEERAGQ